MYCGGIVASCTSLTSEEIASLYGTIYNLLAICYRVLGRKIYHEFKAAEFNVGRAHLCQRFEDDVEGSEWYDGLLVGRRGDEQRWRS